MARSGWKERGTPMCLWRGSSVAPAIRRCWTRLARRRIAARTTRVTTAQAQGAAADEGSAPPPPPRHRQALALAGPLAAQELVIPVKVNLVHVVATVKNRAGQLVGSLHKEDFDIYDNGVRQEVAVFERQTDQPLSVALLVDVSGSTNQDLKFETDSAVRFVRALLSFRNSQDQVALYAFDDAGDAGAQLHPQHRVARSHAAPDARLGRNFSL